MRLDVLVLALLAPLPYLALGLACLGPGRLPLLAPVLGCAVAGFAAEVGMILGVPVKAAVDALVVVAALVAFLRWRRAPQELALLTRVFVPLYLFTAIAASLSPFPVLGAWSGDWLILFDMGRAVVTRSFSVDLLTRPPLFGAAACPLWLWDDGLIPFQLMSVVASAGAVTAALALLWHFRPQASWKLMVPLLLSPFFLHHDAAAWAKTLVAALLVGAVLTARTRQVLASAFFMALAVAAHDGAVIFVPFVLLLHWRAQETTRDRVRALALLAVVGLLVVVPIQVWEVLRYGLAAKVAANPAVKDRSSDPFVVKVALAIVSSFAGWDPLLSLRRWLSNPLRFSKAVVTKESFWLLQSWVTTLSGSILGLAFVFLGRRLWPKGSFRVHRWEWATGAVIPIVFASILTPYYSELGTAQAGLVPLQLGLYVLWVSLLPEEPFAQARALRRAGGLMLVLGTLPWVLLNLPVTMGLRFSRSFAQSFAAGSEGDYNRLLDHHLESLGTVAFPSLPLALGALGAVLFFVARARARSRVRETPLAPAEA